MDMPMKRLLVLVASVLLFISSPVFARPDHSVVRDYTYLVIIGKVLYHRSVPVGSGSAVVIAPGYALSAWHVFNKGNEPGLTISMMYGDKDIPVQVVAKNEKADVVLISGQFVCPCAPIATVMPEIDTEVVSAGYPLYHLYSLQYVTVGHYQGITNDGDSDLAAASFPTTRGASGGGAFFKQDGVWKLYGIISSIGASPISSIRSDLVQEHPFMSFSVPLNSINELLKGTPVAILVR